MSKLFEALFPEGKRKLLVTILALAIGAGFEKYGGGLTDQMVTAILGLVGIFTSGNMVEHIMNVIKGKKPAEVIEQDADYAVPQVREPSPQEYIQAVMGQINELRSTVNGFSEQMKVQAQNTAAIVNVINTMRGAGGGFGGQAQPARPTPNVNTQAGGREL